jgi:1-acyl-sn-glycerol-3-phosphate acyltransferase
LTPPRPSETGERQVGGVAYWFSHLMVRVFFLALLRTRWDRDTRVPRSGGLLLAANHQSYLDPPLIGGGRLGRPLGYLARKSLFKGRFMSWLLTSYGSIPLEDNQGDIAAMREVLRRLEAGQAVLVFPEGSRSFDGAMQEFKPGLAVLLKRSGCPVVPVAIEGPFDAWPRTSKKPRWWTCPIRVRYGDPIPHEELLRDGVPAAMERLAREIDALRMQLRAEIRAKTRGKWPRPGPGDHPRSPEGEASTTHEPSDPPAPSPA